MNRRHHGWSIKKFARTARRYRTIHIQAGKHTLSAADPLPDDLRQALARIHDHRQRVPGKELRSSCYRAFIGRPC